MIPYKSNETQLDILVSLVVSYTNIAVAPGNLNIKSALGMGRYTVILSSFKRIAHAYINHDVCIFNYHGFSILLLRKSLSDNGFCHVAL